MKNKEFIIMTTGSLLLMAFVIFMMVNSYKSQKNKLIREDLKNDSIIFKQNSELKYNDSIYQINSNKLENTIGNHENRLKKLENRKSIIIRDTIVVINN